ncbi:hypothetical protein VFPPC_18289 [Pochonia chlamydosporia 170]|uniref:Uncharacterized protein n=1 Tax=Pochonia chlamydosporia 170 TaxID=1380566 RepID=A0A219ANY1_METCM|nr:hypothetical protein VFPPC_18289 [Pochonia chlamydosporia 170]OWT42550.1 hypothetical protein VFPPC_18289 [Pochonia chlamydosporia 170]
MGEWERLKVTIGGGARVRIFLLNNGWIVFVGDDVYRLTAKPFEARLLSQGTDRTWNTGRIQACRYVTTNDLFAVGERDNKIVVISMMDWKIVKEIYDLDDSSKKFFFAGDCLICLEASTGNIEITPLSGNEAFVTKSFVQRPPSKCAVTDRYFITCGEDGVKVRDPRNGSVRVIRAIDFSYDGPPGGNGFLHCSLPDGGYQWWDLEGNNVDAIVNMIPLMNYFISFSDGRHLYSDGRHIVSVKDGSWRRFEIPGARLSSRIYLVGCMFAFLTSDNIFLVHNTCLFYYIWKRTCEGPVVVSTSQEAIAVAYTHIKTIDFIFRHGSGNNVQLPLMTCRRAGPSDQRTTTQQTSSEDEEKYLPIHGRVLKVPGLFNAMPSSMCKSSPSPFVTASSTKV